MVMTFTFCVCQLEIFHPTQKEKKKFKNKTEPGYIYISVLFKE